ncbi:hypothetical protein [Parafannyhessea umbonata]|uniref:hypothetical protein n=1 Tax=Parafannyhessea umbonata TaxID=604330 RepID=UPI00359C82CA
MSNNDPGGAQVAIGLIGLVCGVLGYVALAVGGDFASFMRGALPGVMIGLSALALVMRPR